jgi:hypothetical protein
MPGDDLVSAYVRELGHFIEIRAVVDHGHIDDASACRGGVADNEVFEERTELGHRRSLRVDHHEHRTKPRNDLDHTGVMRSEQAGAQSMHIVDARQIDEQSVLTHWASVHANG